MSNMITLSPIERNAASPCSSSRFADVTNYGQSSLNGFNLASFKTGLRIIRVVNPDGTVVLYCFADNIVTSLTPTYLAVTNLDCEITDDNYQRYEFEVPISGSGECEIDILSIPRANASGAYVDGDVYCDIVSSRYVIYKKVSGVFVPLFTDEDFTGITESYINRLTFIVDCDFYESIECIFSNYESSFCGRCDCGDICKNKKSNNILKATLMLRELELLVDNEVEYNKKLELYTPVMKKLCQCS